MAAAGFGSAMLADPLIWPLPAPDSAVQQPVMPQSDLAFNLLPTDELFAKDYSPPAVTTNIDFREGPVDLPSDSSAGSEEFRAPAPAPIGMMLLGLIFFPCLAAMYRICAVKRRQRRRRTFVRMRAIIAER